MAPIFKIGTTKAAEDESMIGLCFDKIRKQLQIANPDNAEATILERTEAETPFVEFITCLDRKGWRIHVPQR